MKTCLQAVLLLFIATNSLVAQQSSRKINLFSIAKADSLFNARQWQKAAAEYQGALKIDSNKDNSLAWSRLGIATHNTGELEKALEYYKRSLAGEPSANIRTTVHGRMAKIFGLRNEPAMAIENLQKAVEAGYQNLADLDTAREFSSLRALPDFKQLVTKAEINAFPCKANSLRRQFDFWVGEWEVFVTGTNQRAGHSIIQKASGDCMILENWTSSGPVPHNGKSMNYINPQSGKWEQFWIGSGGMGTVQRFTDGEFRDSVMQFRFESTTAQGKQEGRFRFFNQGADQVRQLNETTPDGGRTWRTNYDLTYRRKKS